MSSVHRVHCAINGRPCAAEVPGRRTLLQLLRDDLLLTGTKEGCGVGTCGACTVLLDGRAVLSCLVLAAQVDGGKIETIEGTAPDGDGLVQAFLEHDAFQCGFCTPGQVMALRGLLRADPRPSEAAIARAVEGNVCRCGAQLRIRAAARAAAGQRDGSPLEAG